MPTSVGKRVLMCLITFRQQSGWCSEKSGALQKWWDEKLWSKWKKMCLYDFMHAVSLVLFSWDLILWHWKWHSILFDWNWNLKTWSFLFDVLGWMIFVNAIVTISLHACCHMVSLGAPWLSMMCGVGIYLPSISTSAAGLTGWTCGHARACCSLCLKARTLRQMVVSLGDSPPGRNVCAQAKQSQWHQSMLSV